ncbi:MAG: nucleotidyltransferase family protein [Burkholderiales bacterium]|nr:nucleotidyltransferase family protein [Burkholderiales bacterium]
MIRQARRADLLPRLGSLLSDAAVEIPPFAQVHFTAAQTFAEAQQQEMRREVKHLNAALYDLRLPLILLKGGAYLAAGLPPAPGRVFNDLDILVPRERLAEVESALALAGWHTTHHSEYDQRYYREWMHELPPLVHVRRLSTVDVHHSILPLTARSRPDARKLLAAVVPAAHLEGVHVLAPEDMVIHAMTHLFHNEELSHGLRDLSDLDLLMRHFGAGHGFWQRLFERALELKLGRPTAYGVLAAHRLLCTPVPQSALLEAQALGPRGLARPCMNVLWNRGLSVFHPPTNGWLTGRARNFLYVRAHWLRMPPLMLARHLFFKAFIARPET